MTDPGRVVGRRYLLLRVIGRGGMGVVWAAKDQTLDRLVAVKEVIPPPRLDEAERRRTQQRVLREARAAGRVASVYSVSVFDVFAEDERSWIVMELLEVPTLADAIRDSGPLSVTDTIAIAVSLLDALHTAHQAGVLHRDVKPANVLLTRRGAVLGDFGIARSDGDPAITTTGVVFGSPAYLAPERVRGETSGRPADLWALGATLYAALEGHGPFDRGEVLAALHAIVSEPVPEPRRAGVLAPLLLKLLNKDPAQRPTADETREMLSLASRGQPAGTMPITTAAGTETTGVAPTRQAEDPPMTEERRSVEPVAGEGERASPRPRRRRGPRWALAGSVLLLAALLAIVLLTVPGGLGGDPDGEANDAETGSTSDPTIGADGDPTPGGLGGDPDGEANDAETGSTSDPTTGADGDPSRSDMSVPAPFETRVLYDFARDLFKPEECFVPSPGQYPFSEIEPDIERLKCISDSVPYTATFWCKADLAGLLADRDLFLSAAVSEPAPVDEPPAGNSTPVDGIQVTFNRTGTNDSRVYWDSETRLCAGELQSVGSDDVDAAVAYWASGR